MKNLLYIVTLFGMGITAYHWYVAGHLYVVLSAVC